MKKLLLLLIVILTGCAMHHRLPLPAVQFQYVDTRINPYVKMLHLKDSNSLILRTATTNIHASNAGNFLVKDSKGNIFFYLLLSGYGHEPVLYSKKLSKVQTDMASGIFDEAATVKKEVVQDYGGLEIFDDRDIDLELYQNRYFTKIRSYAPEFYIEENVGVEERKKFLKIVSDVDCSNYLEAKKWQDIKDKDTIYVHFNYGPMQTKEPRAGRNILKTYSFHVNTLPQHLFSQYGKDSTEVNRSFMRKHKDEIIDYYFFMKNWKEKYSLKPKTLILIDDNGKNYI